MRGRVPHAGAYRRKVPWDRIFEQLKVNRLDLLSFKVAMCVANFPQSVMSRMARVFRECLIEVHPTVTAIKTVPPTLDKK